MQTELGVSVAVLAALAVPRAKTWCGIANS